MQSAITPQPHFIPGYTGHCPEYLYRVGSTYGQLTHKTLLAPCAAHSKNLILMSTTETPLTAKPTKDELKTLIFRQRFTDSIYRHPIIPGYNGFVPRMAAQVGKRFLAAATSGVRQHETDMEITRCEKRHLQHAGLLESGRGLFEPKMCERMIPRTIYRTPLVPVKPHSIAIPPTTCSVKTEKTTYSKATVPHFMENHNENKWILAGYSGHIPMAKMHHGQSNKELTKSALSDFNNMYRFRRFDAWCREDQKPSVGNSTCPSNIDYKIYNHQTGFLPNYAGHVPGHLYKIGLRYALSTANAKGWLKDNRYKDYYDY